MATHSINKRIVRHLSVIYYRPELDPVDPDKTVPTAQVARRGEEIELTEPQEKRLDSLGALLPEGRSIEDLDAEHAAILDAYRGERGDAEAMQRALARARSGAPQLNDGGIVNIDAPGVGASPERVVNVPVGQLADWIKQNKPNADDTVALAEDDPRKAENVLEAERLATGNSPRATVEQRLQKIIDG